MNRVSVKIDGVDYQIAGEKNEAEIVKVAKYIDGELKNISKAAPSLSKTSAAILTSVNIADKLFDREREVEVLKKEISEMKETDSNKNEEVEKEFDNVLLKLEEADSKIADLKIKISKLEADLASKDDTIKRLEATGGQVGGDVDKIVKSLEMNVKEMENKVAVAENMAAEFQNKAYNLQLNYEELKNKTNK